MLNQSLLKCFFTEVPLSRLLNLGYGPVKPVQIHIVSAGAMADNLGLYDGTALPALISAREDESKTFSLECTVLHELGHHLFRTGGMLSIAPLPSVAELNQVYSDTCDYFPYGYKGSRFEETLVEAWARRHVSDFYKIITPLMQQGVIQWVGPCPASLYEKQFFGPPYSPEELAFLELQV